MTEQILTEDEKSALLDGVQSGEIEVQSSTGPSYASVSPFEIGPRARIVKNSYPRLQRLNQMFADRLSKSVALLLQEESNVKSDSLLVKSFGECSAQDAAASVVIVFEAAPLSGKAVITMQSAFVRPLVDAFFGGTGSESESTENHFYTRGELTVCNLFADIVLSTLKEVWAPVLDISAERLDTTVSIEQLDIATKTDPIVASEFSVSIAEQQGNFQMLWPVAMLEPVIPALNGQKTDRDPASDSRWEKAIRSRAADLVVSLNSVVGNAQMNLGELIALNPGDVIDIENPVHATVLAKHVPLAHGRLGVHGGRNAIEMINWLNPLQSK